MGGRGIAEKRGGSAFYYEVFKLESMESVDMFLIKL